MSDAASTTFFRRWRGRTWRAMNSQVWDGWLLGIVAGGLLALAGCILSLWLHADILSFLPVHNHESMGGLGGGLVALATGFMLLRFVVGGPVMQNRAPRGLVLAALFSLVLVCAASVLQGLIDAMPNTVLGVLVMLPSGVGFLLLSSSLYLCWLRQHDPQGLLPYSYPVPPPPFDPRGACQFWRGDAERVAKIPEGTRVRVKDNMGRLMHSGYFVGAGLRGDAPWVAYVLVKGRGPHLAAPAHCVHADWLRLTHRP